jgi:hypothetical protein
LIASNYSTTAQKLCTSNHAVFGNSYCDIKPSPRVNSGMELLVPRRYPTPPKPCKEIPGHWNCSTVEAGDTLAMIAIQFQVDLQLLMEANWGMHPTRCKDCTKCTTPSPDCLKIGQVLAVPVQDEELLRWCSPPNSYIQPWWMRNPKYDCVIQDTSKAIDPSDQSRGKEPWDSVTTDLSHADSNSSFQSACVAAFGNASYPRPWSPRSGPGYGSCTVTWQAGEYTSKSTYYCSHFNGTSDTRLPTDKCRKNWLPLVSGITFPLQGNLEHMEFPSLAVDLFCQANRRSIASCRNPDFLQKVPAVLPQQGPFKVPHIIW